MLVIHDLIEIHAGDVCAYNANEEVQREKEYRSCDKLFNLLPSDLSKELADLWIEFDSQKSLDSKVAKSIDRLHPVLLNFYNDGKIPYSRNVTKDMYMKLNEPVIEASKVFESIINEIARIYSSKSIFHENS